MKPDLPKVIEFSHRYDVKIEHNQDGSAKVVARIKPSKYSTGYKSYVDLPFVGRSADDKEFLPFCLPEQSTSYDEAQVRGEYYWGEFVKYVRGHQKRRRSEATDFAKRLIAGMFGYSSAGYGTERQLMVNHIAECLVHHLRVGLDEHKTDAELAEVAA